MSWEADGKQDKFPPGWDERRVQNVIDYCENQTKNEVVAEDESASQSEFSMLIEVFTELEPDLCEWVIGAFVDSQ